MTRDRRTARRVDLQGAHARLSVPGKDGEHVVPLVNLSPQGACVAVPWSAESASELLLSAWMRSSAVQLILDGSSDAATARVHWVRAVDLDRPVFGLHFVEPVASFASLVRRFGEHCR